MIKFRPFDPFDREIHDALTLEKLLEIFNAHPDVLGFHGIKLKITKDSLEFDRFTGMLDSDLREVYEWDFLSVRDADYVDKINVHLVLWNNNTYQWTTLKIIEGNFKMSCIEELWRLKDNTGRQPTVCGNLRNKNMVPIACLPIIASSGIDTMKIIKQIEWEEQHP